MGTLPGTSLQATGQSPLWVPDTKSMLSIPKFQQAQAAKPHHLVQELWLGQEFGQMGSDWGDPNGTRGGCWGRKQIIVALVSASRRPPQSQCQHPDLTMSLPCSKPICNSPGSFA